MASKTKLFQVHFNLHLKPFNDSVWADYREDLHLTKAQLQKIPQLLKALQNKYKTMKSLRDKMLEQDCIRFAEAYFLAPTYGWSLVNAAFDTRGLGITLIYQLDPEGYDHGWTAESVKEKIKTLGLNEFIRWDQGMFENNNPAIISGSLPGRRTGGGTPHVILGTFRYGPDDITVKQIRKLPAWSSKPQYTGAEAKRASEDAAVKTLHAELNKIRDELSRLRAAQVVLERREAELLKDLSF